MGAADLKYGFLRFSCLAVFLPLSFLWFFFSRDVFLSAAAGVFTGGLDAFLMFAVIEKASKKEPAQAFAHMQKNMFKRAACDLFLAIAAIRAGLNILAFFIAFLFLHIVRFVFIVITAKGRKE
jgi:hypothetical protein